MPLDLKDWPTIPQTAQILGISERGVYRKEEAGKIEIRKRPRGPGRKPENVCNPDDVDKLAAPKAHVLGSGAEVPLPPTRPPVMFDLSPIALALERVLLARMPALPPPPAPEPKPIMTAAEAAERLGVTEKLVIRLVSKGAWPGFRDHDKVWKLRTRDLDNLDVLAGLAKLAQIRADLRALIEQRKGVAA